LRAVRVSVLAFVVCGAAAAGVLAAIIPARNAPINVRWRPDVTAPQQAALEQRFHLAGGHQTEGTTWAYDLTNSSFTNIRAIVRDPAVDDTAHINRLFFRPEFAFDREARIAIGAVTVGAAVSLLLLVRSNVPAASAPVRVQSHTLLRVLGIAPAALLTLAVLILVMAVVGYRPLWADRGVTLAHAAHGGDTATVFRMLSAGSDPNTAGPVPLDGHAEPVVLTPLEAAVESRQVEVVQLLTKMGARADESDRRRLACLATAVSAPEVAVYLRTTMPPAAPPDCAGVRLPAH
jgi:hypothetical protein